MKLAFVKVCVKHPVELETTVIPVDAVNTGPMPQEKLNGPAAAIGPQHLSGVTAPLLGAAVALNSMI
jgi:hypothetical protein